MSDAPRVSLIVAVAENGVIGRSGMLPWRLSADLKRFKTITMGHALVMGRKTYESIGRPLPGRDSIVISRQPNYHLSGVQVAASIEEALILATAHEQVFIIGGGEIFEVALPLVDRLYVTRVHTVIEGDVYFELANRDDWQLVERTEQTADRRNDFDMTFEVYQRRV